MKFAELQPIAEKLQIAYAQKEYPGTSIKVNWILPYPRDEGLRKIFDRCYDNKVPFLEYFTTMQDYDADIYVIGMDANWYLMSDLPTLPSQ